ncbi:MAG: tRNA uracil 4-sulfurtransferase ThiI [Oscillospiraceae bacterium]
MKKILLAKYGEIALKGLNRSSFEAVLLKTIRRRMQFAGEFKVYKAQSTVYIEPLNESADVDRACDILKCIFGLSAINRAQICEKNFESMCETAVEYLADQLQSARTFKVESKRSDKSFPMNSMELSCELGGYILEKFPHLSVTMNKPDLTVVAEVRDFAAYIHSGKIEAAGGMPVGTSGRAAIMLSGGIDSPVAAYTMAKRGLDLCGVHFMSPPYTSERALDKVERLSGLISRYCGNFALFCIPFTETQVAIRDNCPDELFTVLMRRSMMRITNIICGRENCGAIITGESLGQVASQTMLAIQCTDEAAAVPVFRPLIGMDKVEIIEIARKIGTFETSIEPFEDCCTVFTPKHPKTKPHLNEILEAESKVDLPRLELEAANNYIIKMKHFSDLYTLIP